MEPQKIVRSFEIVDHGPECSSYFQGCGTSFSDFEDVSTGIGYSPAEALADALECLSPEWSFSDALEAEALEELGPKEERERDVISPLEEEALPELAWTVAFHASSGCSPADAEHEDREDARGTVAWILRKRRKGGFYVGMLERGSKWEIREPESSHMVSDSDGTLVLFDNKEAREKERENLQDYPSELHYFLSVRVSS